MVKNPPEQYSKKRVIIGAAGMAAAGLAPLVAGTAGVWSYFTKGDITSRTGEVLAGLSGVVTSALFLLAGLWMIGYAAWMYHRHTKNTGS